MLMENQYLPNKREQTILRKVFKNLLRKTFIWATLGRSAGVSRGLGRPQALMTGNHRRTNQSQAPPDLLRMVSQSMHGQ